MHALAVIFDGLLFYGLLPVAVLAVVVAALRWRNRRLRVLVLTAHLLASFALILFSSGSTTRWAQALIPGMCLAGFRLAIAGAELRARWRSHASSPGSGEQ